MSILYENNSGTFLCVERYFNTVTRQICKINSDLFQISSPYKLKSTSKRKKTQTKSCREKDASFLDLEKDAIDVQGKYSELLPILRNEGFLKNFHQTEQENNSVALKTADFVYEESSKHLINDATGTNLGPVTIKTIQNSRFIFPENCRFFCKDVKEIKLLNEQFDLILLDPPWWNKYIRRKRKKCPHAYDMMYNCDLKTIPVETLLDDYGIVAVWCTNSPQHLKYLIDEIFPKWNVKFTAKWFWLKVTVHGETICEFSKPPGKQPFEQLVIGYRKRKMGLNLPPNGNLLVSVPSAIHSNKPPLVEVLQPFLPNHPKCLEIFARYLLPNWTSYGNEALRFQHECLYKFND